MGLIYVNGALVSDEAAQISVRDHGLVVGDGVFETVLVSDSRPFALTRHLARLERSAAGLGLPPVDREEVRRAVAQVTDANPVELGRLRITYTAGLGPLGSGRGGGPAGLVVALDEDHPPAPTSRVTVVPYRRNEHGALVGLKTTSYAENALALAHAAELGSDEAIFANTAGLLCEGTGSNVFVVIGGAVLTPRLSTGCLAGVTRALVLEHSKSVEDDLAIDQFAPGLIEEAFLTSTLRDVQPIAAIDGVDFSEVPGPRTRELIAAFATLRATEIDP
jgi:branched-chain amino acid aminotransferase